MHTITRSRKEGRSLHSSPSTGRFEYFTHAWTSFAWSCPRDLASCACTLHLLAMPPSITRCCPEMRADKANAEQADRSSGGHRIPSPANRLQLSSLAPGTRAHAQWLNFMDWRLAWLIKGQGLPLLTSQRSGCQTSRNGGCTYKLWGSSQAPATSKHGPDLGLQATERREASNSSF